MRFHDDDDDDDWMDHSTLTVDCSEGWQLGVDLYCSARISRGLPPFDVPEDGLPTLVGSSEVDCIWGKPSAFYDTL